MDPPGTTLTRRGARYTRAMKTPIARLAPAAALAAATLLLAACGNKGPLVHAPAEPPPVVPMEADAGAGATLPDTTPPEQPPATDVAAPPPADTVDETTPPPATDDDGG